MRSSRRSIFSPFAGVALFLGLGLAGCGDFCIAGFSANGSGAVNIKAGNPSPPCSLPHVNAMVRTVALKTPACKTCSNAARVEHVFVTLQGIQLNPDSTDDTSPGKWLEIAPELAIKPHQIDLIGDSRSELLRENAFVPAGSYREVRLKLFNGSSETAELGSENACGGARWNCLIMQSGQVEELESQNEESSLLLPFDTDSGSGDFVLMPDSRVELQLRLEPRQVFSYALTAGWKLHFVLAGHAAIEPQKSSETEMITPE